ncbi:MAG: aldo/keto reductase [Lachnospiraceae bacterium]
MEYIKLGKTGLKVSRLCLGTMSFGTRTTKEEAFRIMDRALELGINFFDTANVYGNSQNTECGLTETIIGEWFAQGGNRRERVVLSTKVHNQMFDEKYGPNDEPGLSAYKIYNQLNDSLKRLQTDHIDLYLMHHVDRNVSWDELYGAFENVINQGKVYYAGSCNFGGRHLSYAKGKAEQRNFTGLVCEQHKYNLLCRLPELEVIPAIKETGMGMMVWSPLEGGLLAENILNPTSNIGKRVERSKKLTTQQREQLQKYADLCKKSGESESNVALAWLLHNPAVTCPIIGPRTVEQLENSIHALDVKLNEDILKQLDEIFPGYKEAPEEYSW